MSNPGVPLPLSLPLPLPAPSLAALLHRLAVDRPDVAALSAREPGQSALPPPLSFGALARRADALAQDLANRWRVSTGDRVAWLGLNHPTQIALLFALARLGAVLVPLNHRLAPAEWAALLADCTPRCLVHDAAFADAAAALCGAPGGPIPITLSDLTTEADTPPLPAPASESAGSRPRRRCCWFTPRAPPWSATPRT